ncbi:MAG: hypothetical protein ACPGUV_12625 [Polyangiales bacterium]
MSDLKIARRTGLNKASVVKLRTRAQENLQRRTRLEVSHILGIHLDFFQANDALKPPDAFLLGDKMRDVDTDAPSPAAGHTTPADEERRRHLITAIKRVLREENASEYEHRALWQQWARIEPKEPADWQDAAARRHAAARLLRTLLGERWAAYLAKGRSED